MGVIVTVLVGWDEGPFYYDSGDPEDSLNHWIEDETIRFLRIGPELVADLTEWDEEFQDTFNGDDVHASGFPDEEAEIAWIQRGKDLAARLKRESPVVAWVDYQAYGCIPKGTCMI